MLQKLSTQNIPPTAISNNTQTAPIAKPAEYQNIDDQNCLQVMNDTDRILEAQTSFQISAEYDQEGESEFKSTDFISEGNDSFFLTRNLLSVNELEQTSQFSVYDEINSIFCFSSTRMSFQSSIHPKRGWNSSVNAQTKISRTWCTLLEIKFNIWMRYQTFV